MMKVLFIGATGLVGSHVIPFLKEKFAITPAAIDGGIVAGLPVATLDICDWEAVDAITHSERFDAVVYCATADYRGNNQGGNEALRRYYENCIEVSVRGAYHVFEAAYRAGINRVIHIGSLSTMLGWPLREEFDAATPDRPDSVYAATKIFGENVGRVYAYQPHFRGRKPDGVSLSPMQVICLRLGQPFISYQEWAEGRHSGSRVAVHVEDIAYAIECALFTGVKYGVYTIVSEVENPRIDPGMYEEIGYSPQWKFTEEGLVNVSRAAIRL